MYDDKEFVKAWLTSHKEKFIKALKADYESCDFDFELDFAQLDDTLSDALDDSITRENWEKMI